MTSLDGAPDSGAIASPAGSDGAGGHLSATYVGGADDGFPARSPSSGDTERSFLFDVSDAVHAGTLRPRESGVILSSDVGMQTA